MYLPTYMLLMKLDATDQKVCCMTLLAISNKYNLCVSI